MTVSLIISARIPAAALSEKRKKMTLFSATPRPNILLELKPYEEAVYLILKIHLSWLAIIVSAGIIVS